MADGSELLERRVRGPEALLRFLELPALHERAAEHDVRLADLVEEVVAALEQLQRVPRVLFGPIPVLEVEVHGRQAADRLRRVALRVDLDGDGEGCLQLLDRLLRLSEQQ